MSAKKAKLNFIGRAFGRYMESAETLEEHAKYLNFCRKRSIISMIVFMFLSSINFTACIPSLWPYMKYLRPGCPEVYLGISYAAYSFGQLIGSPLFGYLASIMPVKRPRLVRFLPDYDHEKRGAKLIIIVGMVLEILGSILYANAPEFSSLVARTWAVILARFIIGFGVGGSAVYRGYINVASRDKERDWYNTMLTIAQSVGFIIGPAVQMCFSFFPAEGLVNVPGFRLNTYTAIGHLTVVVTIGTMIISIFGFYEVYPRDIESALSQASQKLQESKQTDLLMTDKMSMQFQPQQNGKKFEQQHQQKKPADRLLLLWLLFLYFMVFASFVAIESMMSPASMDYLGWEGKVATKNLSIITALGAILTIVIFCLQYTISKRRSSDEFLLAGTVIITLSCYLLVPVFPPGPVLNAQVLNKTAMLDKPFQLTANSRVAVINLLNEREILRYGDLNQSAIDMNATLLSEGACNPFQKKWCMDKIGLTFFQLMISFTFFLFGYTFCYLAIYLIFTKAIGGDQNSWWMGWLTAVGSLARCFMPISIASAYDWKGSFVGFCGLGVFCTGATIVTFVLYFMRGRKLLLTSSSSKLVIPVEVDDPGLLVMQDDDKNLDDETKDKINDTVAF